MDKEHILMISARDKRKIQREKEEMERHERDEAYKQSQAEKPRRITSQTREALSLIDSEIQKCNGNECSVYIRDVCHDSEERITKSLKRKGYKITTQYKSYDNYEYGLDGEMHSTGSGGVGVVFTIRW